MWVPDFSTTDTLVVKTGEPGSFTDTWATSDYRVEPLNPINGEPYTAIVAVDRVFPRFERHKATIEVTAQWGWAAVPPRVKQACAIQAGVLFKRATEGAAPIVTVDGTTLNASMFLDHQAKLLLDRLDRPEFSFA